MPRIKVAAHSNKWGRVNTSRQINTSNNVGDGSTLLIEVGSGSILLITTNTSTTLSLGIYIPKSGYISDTKVKSDIRVNIYLIQR